MFTNSCSTSTIKTLEQRLNKIVFAELIEQFNLSLPQWKRQKTKYFMII